MGILPHKPTSKQKVNWIIILNLEVKRELTGRLKLTKKISYIADWKVWLQRYLVIE